MPQLENIAAALSIDHLVLWGAIQTISKLVGSGWSQIEVRDAHSMEKFAKSPLLGSLLLTIKGIEKSETICSFVMINKTRRWIPFFFRCL